MLLRSSTGIFSVSTLGAREHGALWLAGSDPARGLDGDVGSDAEARIAHEPVGRARDGCVGTRALGDLFTDWTQAKRASFRILLNGLRGLWRVRYDIARAVTCRAWHFLPARGGIRTPPDRTTPPPSIRIANDANGAAGGEGGGQSVGTRRPPGVR